MSNMFLDMAEQHPLLGMSPKFADHTEFTQQERSRLLVVDIVLAFWIILGVAYALTQLGWATGYPQPLCELIYVPGTSIAWADLPATWAETMIVEPRVASFVTLCVSLAVTPVTKFVSGSRFLQFAYENEGYGHGCRQGSATTVVFFWLSSGLVYATLAALGRVKVEHFAADRCVDVVCGGGANCTQVQARMGQIPGMAYITSWSTDTGACETTYLNSTPWVGGVPEEGSFGCYPTVPSCAGADRLDFMNLEAGDQCEEPVTYLPAVVAPPMYLLVIDWLVVQPLLYAIGRCVGCIKKPTAPLLRLVGHEEEDSKDKYPIKNIEDDYVEVGLGKLYAQVSSSETLGETASAVLFVVTLGAFW